jgi:hypothetical protein
MADLLQSVVHNYETLEILLFPLKIPARPFSRQKKRPDWHDRIEPIRPQRQNTTMTGRYSGRLDINLANPMPVFKSLISSALPVFVLEFDLQVCTEIMQKYGKRTRSVRRYLRLEESFHIKSH